MDDKTMIELYFRRDENAVTQTQQRYGKQLNALAFRILQNKEDAEECENDTYMKAWNSIPPQRPQYFFAFLARICRNTALNMLKKQKAEKRDAVVVELTNELSECLPDHALLQKTEERELGEIISGFLRSVSKENRVIFIRRYFLTESVTEIAKALGISESKVKSALFNYYEEKQTVFITQPSGRRTFERSRIRFSKESISRRKNCRSSSGTDLYRSVRSGACEHPSAKEHHRRKQRQQSADL